ncbi:MAG TPA: sigma-70 family RNA polymerase sigma factor [Acidisarcina sp.]|nr:sigma-70 family RNA polymerase sigma factor [Acidisarcina sp.]
MQFQTFDAAYIKKLQEGDARTQEHFVRYFSELIHLKLRSRLKSRDAIEDVCQETFTRVLTALRSEGAIRQPERLGAYVNSVCNNVLLEYYRAGSRSDPIDEVTEATVASPEPNALNILLSKDSERVVRRILAEMPSRDLKLLRGVLLEERDKEDVCRELGVDREYLRVLIHRAKLSFKNVYLKRFGAGRPY